MGTISFYNEQQMRELLARRPGTQCVFLDADGTSPAWLGVVVQRDEGMVYGTQCAGLSTEMRYAQGYYVPAGGWKYEVDEGAVEIGTFTEVFHQEGACQWGWRGADLPAERLRRLRALVAELPWWGGMGGERTGRLELDEGRLGEVAEAWIPVVSPAGPGVLLYKNCD